MLIRYHSVHKTTLKIRNHCTCDCGGNSSKCVSVTADDIINPSFETSNAAYNLYVHYARKREHRALTRTGYEALLVANTMHDHGLPTSKIMGLMVGQVGSYANVGFTKKDLDNHIQRSRHTKLIGGDSTATISYPIGKADVDPMAMARYSATDEGWLANLFWADDICRADYQCFRDVLAFDTTY
ncbi:hypothetical protein AHAS_Ahas13G0344400 [Arachis hypogaea]